MSVPHTADLHQLSQLVQALDLGLIVTDRQLRVRLWNHFMETHSGLRASQARGHMLTELCPELPADWLQRKVDIVVELKARAYSNWQQRPYLFQFSNSRPVTGQAPAMLQNVTFLPITNLNKDVTEIGIVIQDVTELANSLSG